MSWEATHRYGIREAPAALGLVQDLHNTRGIGGYGPDLLEDRAERTRWFERATARWAKLHGVPSPKHALKEQDFVRLRKLRDTVTALLAGERAPLTVSSRLTMDETGQLKFAPSGAGVEWLEAAVAAEIFTAQLDGSWPRLKLCKNPECASAFYDASRNNSGVWHDVHVCGNRFNLAAARARQKAR